MDIKILQMTQGAKEARGIAVIIDVFRAFTTECYIMAAGADQLIAVGDMALAYEYKEKHPDAFLVGERHGVMLPGFDRGNSPSQIQGISLVGKTVLHTTSAGTQGLAAATDADIVLTGSLANAKAIARFIKGQNPDTVSLVCMGLEAVSETQEDNLRAEYIKALLENRPFDLEPEIEKLKTGDGAKFFDPAQQDVFPQADFHLSVKADSFDFVLKVDRVEDGLHYIKRIDV